MLTTASNTPIIVVTTIPVPTDLWMSEVSFFPAQILRYEAAPSPKQNAKAFTIQMTGKDTPVAAFPI